MPCFNDLVSFDDGDALDGVSLPRNFRVLGPVFSFVRMNEFDKHKNKNRRLVMKRLRAEKTPAGDPEESAMLHLLEYTVVG